MIEINEKFPSLIKYMGSKTDLIKFIECGINLIHKKDQIICDLFAGSATLSGALRGQCKIISNDIQEYSKILATAYLSKYDYNKDIDIDDICNKVLKRVNNFKFRFNDLNNRFDYNREFELNEFKEVEREQQNLIEYEEFEEFDEYYLFTKYYSGTYWSYEQCIYIDSIKKIADEYRENEAIYSIIMAALMYAMAYNSQSTGHYAQYRDANTISSMNDILIYRRKDILEYFKRKMIELKNELITKQSSSFEVTTLDYEECLRTTPENSLVYADPPYCFVHYSRFYHVLETLVKYDYPEIKYKGRYREDRHQSPFCIKTKVKDAFHNLFKISRDRRLELVLSYSNSGTNTIALEELVSEAFITLNNIENTEEKKRINNHIRELLIEFDSKFNEEYGYYKIDITGEKDYILKYDIKLLIADYNHSTMGRKDDRIREVKEVLIIASLKG